MVAGEVEVGLCLRLLTAAATTPLDSHLRYRADEPFEVRLEFDGPRAVEWSFARDLLRSGLEAPSGLGDVRIWPGEAPGQVFLRLSSPAGEAILAADAADLHSFMSRTDTLVPEGEESGRLDLEGELAGLLGPGGPAFGRAGDVG